MTLYKRRCQTIDLDGSIKGFLPSSSASRLTTAMRLESKCSTSHHTQASRRWSLSLARATSRESDENSVDVINCTDLAPPALSPKATVASTGRHRNVGSKPAFGYAQAAHDGSCFRRRDRQEAMASRLYLWALSPPCHARLHRRVGVFSPLES